MSLGNANRTGPWVSEPSCFPCAEVHRYILAEQISSLLEGTSSSHCETMELLSGFTVKWRGASEPCDDGEYEEWQLGVFFWPSGLQINKDIQTISIYATYSHIAR